MRKAELICCGPSLLVKLIGVNNDDVRVKRRNPKSKKGSVFDIVGIYSSEVKMTLKVALAPMETT